MICCPHTANSSHSKSEVLTSCHRVLWCGTSAVWKRGKTKKLWRLILQTDHQSLKYLQKAKTKNCRFMIWALLLQPFPYIVQVIPGKDKVGADYLTRSAPQKFNQALGWIGRRLSQILLLLFCLNKNGKHRQMASVLHGIKCGCEHLMTAASSLTWPCHWGTQLL